MNSEQAQTTAITGIVKYLPIAERIFITALVIGLLLMVMQLDSTVTRVSLVGLGVTFFLLAYRPVDIPQEDNELGTFSQLLGLMILPKVLWISCAVSAIGIALHILKFGTGSQNMLMIGGGSTAFASFLLLVLLMSGVKHVKLVAPVLLRSVPLCVVCFYILFA